MENTSPNPPKKGLGPLAWIGIGCGGIVLLGIIAFVVVSVMFGGKIKQFAEEAQANPARATASMMVTASVGQIEMVAEDDTLKRYTVREKANGKLTTIYWDAKKQVPEIVPGDFTAIPVPPDDATGPTPTPN